MNPYPTHTAYADPQRDPRGFNTADLLAIVNATTPLPFVGYTMNPDAYERLLSQATHQEMSLGGDGFYGFFGGVLVHEVALQSDDAIEWHDRKEMEAYVRRMEFCEPEA